MMAWLARAKSAELHEGEYVELRQWRSQAVCVAAVLAAPLDVKSSTVQLARCAYW